MRDWWLYKTLHKFWHETVFTITAAPLRRHSHHRQFLPTPPEGTPIYFFSLPLRLPWLCSRLSCVPIIYLINFHSLDRCRACDYLTMFVVTVRSVNSFCFPIYSRPLCSNLWVSSFSLPSSTEIFHTCICPHPNFLRYIQYSIFRYFLIILRLGFCIAASWVRELFVKNTIPI